MFLWAVPFMVHFISLQGHSRAKRQRYPFEWSLPLLDSLCFWDLCLLQIKACMRETRGYMLENTFGLDVKQKAVVFTCTFENGFAVKIWNLVWVIRIDILTTCPNLISFLTVLYTSTTELHLPVHGFMVLTIQIYLHVHVLCIFV